MSFSKSVKRELCELKEASKLNRKIITYGMLYGMRESREREGYLQLSSENDCAVQLIQRLLTKAEFIEEQKYLLIKTDDKVKDYLQLAEDDRSVGLFLRGVFMVCGTVANPNTEYHMEMAIDGERKTKEIFTMIHERGIPIKQSRRKSGLFLYLKESELISDFLTFIGAYQSSMEIMNVKIYKELRNNVNRVVNCETANIEKTTRAATRQADDIELIYDLRGKEFLSHELQQIAELRLQNIDMSLKDIGELCEPKLSRSGVNHRLKRIEKIAEELRAGSF